MDKITLTFDQVVNYTAALQIFISALIGISVWVGLRNDREGLARIFLTTAICISVIAAWVGYSISVVTHDGLTADAALSKALIFGSVFGVITGIIPMHFGITRNQFALGLGALISSAALGLATPIFPIVLVGVWLGVISSKSANK